MYLHQRESYNSRRENYGRCRLFLSAVLQGAAKENAAGIRKGSVKNLTRLYHVVVPYGFLRNDCLLKEQCHEDFAVLVQFCAKIITLRL